MIKWQKFYFLFQPSYAADRTFIFFVRAANIRDAKVYAAGVTFGAPFDAIPTNTLPDSLLTKLHLASPIGMTPVLVEDELKTHSF